MSLQYVLWVQELDRSRMSNTRQICCNCLQLINWWFSCCEDVFCSALILEKKQQQGWAAGQLRLNCLKSSALLLHKHHRKFDVFPMTLDTGYWYLGHMILWVSASGWSDPSSCPTMISLHNSYHSSCRLFDYECHLRENLVIFYSSESAHVLLLSRFIYLFIYF